MYYMEVEWTMMAKFIILFFFLQIQKREKGISNCAIKLNLECE